MEPYTVIKPNLEEAFQYIKQAIASKMFVLILGECRVDYEGRGASRLELGERLVIIKQDNAVLVHRPEGYSPVNWQPSVSIIETIHKPSIGLVIHVIRDKPREYLTIVFVRVDLLVVGRLRDTGEFVMYLDENAMREIIVENPWLIENGLKIVEVEKSIGEGYIDIYAIDNNGRHVLLELKRITATREAVLQLWRYMESYKAEYGEIPRGILVAPSFSPTGIETALRLGVEYKYVDLKKLWELYRRKQIKKPSLRDYVERKSNE